MAKESRYSITFWCKMEPNGDFEVDARNRPVVRVGISTKPDKSLSFFRKSTPKSIFVFYVGKIQNPSTFLHEIEELEVSKGMYLLEPLSPLLKRKCGEDQFKPYLIKRSAKRVDTEARGKLDI